MRFTFILISVLSVISCSTVPANKNSKAGTFLISKHLRVKPLNERTFVIKDISFYNSNVLVTKLPDSTVLIASSPIDTVKTVDMLNWIQKTLEPKKIIAINTHFHADGTGGNEGYQSQNVEIWSSKDTHKLYSKRAKSMRLSLAEFIKDEQLSKNVLKRKDLPANKFFDLKKDIHWMFGNEQVVIHYPGPAHSSDNIVVYLPKQKILFGGCMLRALSWNSLGNTKDADLERYYGSVKSLLQFKSKVVVPGHGNIGNKTLIQHTMNLALNVKNKSPKILKEKK